MLESRPGSSRRLKILFVTFGLPVPPISGARLRDYHFLIRVAARHDVSVLSLLESQPESAHLEEFRRFGLEAEGFVAPLSLWKAAPAALAGRLQGRPLATGPFYVPALARRLRQLVIERNIDLVQIEHSFLAPYGDALPRGHRCVRVLSFHNVGVHQYRSMVDMSAGWARVVARLKARSMEGWEARIARRFDHAIVVSDFDARTLRELGVQVPITTIVNGVDCDAVPLLDPPPPGPDELLFVGTMGYRPNRDAAEFFCREVLPRIRAERPNCRLTLAGTGGRRWLAHLAQPGLVDVTDRVDDLRPYYQRARVVVVPLRAGSGTRLKILEAMAYGRPVVSTTIGCEGLDLRDGGEIVIADEPSRFARRVGELLQDPRAWALIREAARRRVEERYAWGPRAEALMSLHEGLVLQRDRASRSAVVSDSGPERP